MFQLPEKGNIEYLNKKKKINLMITVFSFLAVIIIYITGLIIYKNNRSVYTVIAAVAALPAAKALISYIMVAPYHSLSKEESGTVSEVVEGKEFLVLYDLIITSEEKAMHLPLSLIYNGHLLIYSQNPKQSASELETYIKKILTCRFSSVKVYKELPEMLKMAKSFGTAEKQDNDTDELIRQRLSVYAI